MSMLYKIVSGEDIRKSNNDIDAVEEFRPCSSSELKYIFLTYDYETPLRRMPPKDRKEEALRMSGYRKTSKGAWEKKAKEILNNKNDQVVEAIKAFRRLNHNIERETLLSYDQQLLDFQKKTAEPKESKDDWKLAIDINKALPILLKQRKEIIDLLDLTEEEFIEDEDKKAKKIELSIIDQVNSRILDLAEKKDE